MAASDLPSLPLPRISPCSALWGLSCLGWGVGSAHLSSCPPKQGPPASSAQTEWEEGRTPPLGFLSDCFSLNCAVISKSLESVLSLGPRPTGGGSSPPELRHARAVTRGPPGLPSRPPLASNPSQPSQPPRERPPWPRREPPASHPPGTPGPSKATVPSGGLSPDPELQRRIMEVRSPGRGLASRGGSRPGQGPEPDFVPCRWG